MKGTYEFCVLQETVDQRRIQREISILRRLTHGCIIQLLEIVETEHFIYLVSTAASNRLDWQCVAAMSCFQTDGHNPSTLPATAFNIGKHCRDSKDPCSYDFVLVTACPADCCLN